MNYQAIIFDCDGVLVNSEDIAVRTEMQLLSSIGIQYDKAAYIRRYCGTADADFVEGLQADALEQTGSPLPSNFLDNLSDAIHNAFETELTVIEGAAQFATLWSGPKAVASSTSVARLNYKLAKVGLAEVFGKHAYSADLVPQAKPHPDIFLYAAQALQVRPENCLAIEDSTNGIIAAKRAGMTAIGLTAGGHCLDSHEEELIQAGADRCFNSFENLSSYLNLS